MTGAPQATRVCTSRLWNPRLEATLAQELAWRGNTIRRTLWCQVVLASFSLYERADCVHPGTMQRGAQMRRSRVTHPHKVIVVRSATMHTDVSEGGPEQRAELSFEEFLRWTVRRSVAVRRLPSRAHRRGGGASPLGGGGHSGRSRIFSKASGGEVT